MSGMSPGLSVRAALETLRDLFYPRHCAGCASSLADGWLCSPCRAGIKPIEAPRCDTCSQPFSGSMDRFTCVNCRGRAFYFDCAVAVMQSRGVMRDLVHRFKYGGELWLGGLLGDFLEQGLADERLEDMDFDGVVAVPLHARRRREREYNQAEILARELARRRGWAFFSPLERVRYTVTQTHFDRQRRMQNLRGAFALRQNGNVQGKDLLLVDDVLTTGSTLDECARVLLEAGAQSVRALTVARG